MNLLKVLCVAVSVTAVAVAEPALPGQYEYLPPDKGYKYQPPKIPFPTPSVPPYSPPTPSRPTYGPPPTPPRPTYGPPTTPAPPTYGPPPGPTPPTPTFRPPFTTSPPYGKPVPPPGPHDHHHDHVHEPGMPFDFEYAVKDDVHGADYGHRASSNGDVVQGEYRNLLPDGRVQVVRYTADWATGFHAEVSYQGEAQYPAPKPADAYGPPQQQQTGY